MNGGTHGLGMERPHSDAPARHGEGRTAARVLVDLAALAGNYRAIGSATAAEVAGVVKADGYGLGVSGIARALYEAGCRTFFTAFGHEAVELRRMLDDVEIFVLMPRVGGEAHLLHEHRLIPCLFDLDGVDRWIGSAAAHGTPGRAALHVETGIHRLGLGREELGTLLGDRSRRSRLDVTLLMSHLACADEPSAPANRRQLDRFRAVRGAFPAARASLANSAGTFFSDRTTTSIWYGPELRCTATIPITRTSRRGCGRSRRSKHGWDRLRRWSPARASATGAWRPATARGGSESCSRATPTASLVRSTGPDGGWRSWSPGNRVPLFGDRLDGYGHHRSEQRSRGCGRSRRVGGDHRPERPIERVAEQAGTIPYEILTGIGPRVERVHVRT